MLVTTAGDFEATVWKCNHQDDNLMDQDSWLMSQRMNFGTKIPQCSAIGVTDDASCTLIAMGFADNNVRIFSKSKTDETEEEDFALCCTLSGHQNWVRSVDFVNIGTSRMLLATGGQDRHIRLWSIELEDDKGRDKSDQTSLNKLGVTKYAPKPRMMLGGKAYVAILESLLVGHEDWVMSVAWNMRTAGADTIEDLVLLTSSMDRTMILWRKDAGSGRIFFVEFQQCIVRSTLFFTE
jgi:elongator complex protein 2